MLSENLLFYKKTKHLISLPHICSFSYCKRCDKNGTSPREKEEPREKRKVCNNIHNG